jgi:hypothetical protein
MSATANAVTKATSTVTTVVDNLLADLVSLDNPVTASAVVAFVLSVTGGGADIGLSGTTLLAIVGGIGTVSLVVKRLFSKSS